MINIVEAMIDELTTVCTYSTYVQCNIKKDINKTSSRLVKNVVKDMCREMVHH